MFVCFVVSLGSLNNYREMTTAKTTKELTSIYNKVVDDFKPGITGSIHNLLWQIIVNRVNENSNICFYDVYDNGGYWLVRVFENENGYSNTMVEFADGITDKKGSEICKFLNKRVFSINEKEADRIIASSFKQSFIEMQS